MLAGCHCRGLRDLNCSSFKISFVLTVSRKTFKGFKQQQQVKHAQPCSYSSHCIAVTLHATALLSVRQAQQVLQMQRFHTLYYQILKDVRLTVLFISCHSMLLEYTGATLHVKSLEVSVSRLLTELPQYVIHSTVWSQLTASSHLMSESSCYNYFLFLN